MKSALIFALLAGVQSVQFVKEIKSESWYDKTIDAHEAAQEIKDAQPIVNKFDGLIHGADGKTYDPVTHKQIDREDDTLLQVRFVKNMNQDGFDKSMDRKQEEMARAPVINKFDGLIHAQNGKVYDPVSKKEVTLEESYVQTGDVYDETYEKVEAKENYL